LVSKTNFCRVTLALFSIAAALLFVGSAEGQPTQIKNQHYKAFQANLAQDKSDPGAIRVAQDFHPAAPRQDTPFQARPTYKTVAMNLRGFGVPFQINADNDSFIEVQLYVSRDQGSTWQFSARQATDQEEFPFQANEDGEYWFALKTLNRDRKLIPEGDPQVDLKIVVDTVKPELDFRINTDAAGRIACRWRATDKNIAPQTLRIFYQPIGADGKHEDWKQVPIKLSGAARAGIYADQLAWWPETTQRAINVAVEIKDTAGNTVQLTRNVQVARAGWRHQQKSTAQRTAPPAQLQTNWATPEPVHQSGQDNPPAAPESSIPPAGRKVAQADHPPSVVCKDGVCQLVKSPRATQRRDHGRNEFVHGDFSQTKSNQLNSQQRPMKLVGSKAVFADPPVPEGYVAQQTFDNSAPPVPSDQSDSSVDNQYSENRQSFQAPGGSQVWQSETDNWNLPTQSSSSTARQPHPLLAPDPFSGLPDLPRQPVTDVPSNAATMTTRGDRVIGESSTMGGTNQYRGLNSQNGQAIPKSTLLPGVAGSRSRVEAGPNQTRLKSFSQPKSLSSIGYRSPEISSSSAALTRDVMPTRNSKAPIQIIGSQRFKLNYGIDSIDPSGVARVDLWLTRDDGKTWQTWGSKSNKRGVTDSRSSYIPKTD